LCFFLKFILKPFVIWCHFAKPICSEGKEKVLWKRRKTAQKRLYFQPGNKAVLSPVQQ